MNNERGELIFVEPDSPYWAEYLARMLAYLDESWPDHGRSADALERELRDRFAQGGRGLFLFAFAEGVCGLANVYAEDACLHVAELGIDPTIRRAGLGRRLLELLIDWGRRQGCDELKVEVDRELARANAFWSRQQLTLDASGARNVYVAPIRPVVRQPA